MHIIDFPGQRVNLRAIVPAVNLAHLGTLYKHPVIRPICVIFWDQLAVLAEALSNQIGDDPCLKETTITFKDFVVKIHIFDSNEVWYN